MLEGAAKIVVVVIIKIIIIIIIIIITQELKKLKNSIAMPNLLYILRTSPCANNPLLQVFDIKLKEGLQTILNVELSDLQWKQASLPVHMGGLGVRSACMLAPSAFLASAAATLPLQEVILSSSLAEVEDKAVSIAKASWLNISNTIEPLDSIKHIQRAWDTPVTTATYNNLLAACTTAVDQARLKAMVSPHAGDWLHASPLTAVGLRLSDKAIRVATGIRIGTNLCQPHTCIQHLTQRLVSSINPVTLPVFV